MKFFVDTANIEEIKAADAWGIVNGVTTNPTLVSREGRDFETTIKEICAVMGDRPVSAEVVSTEASEMVAEARILAGWADNVVVKIPMIKEGMKAVHILSQEGIRTNVTLVFTAAQALLAAKAGASFASPFVGRLEDISTDGMGLVNDIVDIYSAYDYATEIIVASVRRPEHIVMTARMGADIATVPFKVLDQMFAHPLTDRGMENFLSDWAKLQKQLGNA